MVNKFLVSHLVIDPLENYGSIAVVIVMILEENSYSLIPR